MRLQLDGDHEYRFPLVTFCLVAANMLAYVVFVRFEQGAAIRALGFVSSDPKIGTLLTSMFYHGSVYHLCWNMLFLWLFGPKVEEALGRLQFLLFYFGSGAAALLVNMMMLTFFAPAAVNMPVVGASGAIAGVLGMYAVRFYRTNLSVLGLRIPAVLILGAVLLQQVIAGLSVINDPEPGGVSYWSHVGGAAFGIVMAEVLSLGAIASKEHMMQQVRDDLEEGKTLNAVQGLEQLLLLDPEDADAHRELGRLCALQDEKEQSTACYKRSIEEYLTQQHFEKAISCFSEFRHYHRGAHLDAALEYQIARHLVDSGCWRVAIQMLEGLAAHYPNTPEGELSLIKAGDTYLNCLREPESAVACYERCLREYPQSPLRAIIEKSITDSRNRMEPNV